MSMMFESPDANCFTLPNGDCVGTACMHNREHALADPTAFPIEFDPREQRMRGTAVHGDMDFDVPFMSQIEGNLWQGGCKNGLMLPPFITHVVSLYKWERYVKHDDIRTFEEVTMYDSLDGPDRAEVVRLATLVNECRKDGPTLVHCQAGLNRSGLVAGTALVLSGHTPAEALALLRSSRSPAVLCNPVFESWLLAFEADPLPSASAGSPDA